MDSYWNGSSASLSKVADLTLPRAGCRVVFLVKEGLCLSHSQGLVSECLLMGFSVALAALQSPFIWSVWALIVECKVLKELLAFSQTWAPESPVFFWTWHATRQPPHPLEWETGLCQLSTCTQACPWVMSSLLYCKHRDLMDPWRRWTHWLPFDGKSHSYLWLLWYFHWSYCWRQWWNICANHFISSLF